MQREPVSSSNIKAIGYEDGKLEVEFNSGDVHCYDCDEGTYRKFREADSKGKFFHQHIRSRPSRKL